MGLKDDLIKNASDIIAAKRELRDGRKVPESGDMGFLGTAVKLDAVFLYADLRDSTTLATKDKNVASDVFQVFLSTMSRVIKSEGGEIRSFDGDRVMAVFIGDSRFDDAARCGLKMSWAFLNIVKPKLEAAFPKELAGFKLAYTVGIDAGEIWAVRGGVRNDSDIVWVGRAPNLGAKLSGMKSGYRTYVTGTVYDKLSTNVKNSGNPSKSMWDERSWTDQNKMRIFRSNWTWPIN